MTTHETERLEQAQAFLRSALEAEEELELWRERVEELAARCGTRTASWSGTPGSRGQGPERLWIVLADARNEEHRRRRNAERRHRAVERAVLGVSEARGREVLRLRYLEGLTWPAIRERIGCSERTVYRLHSRAAAEVGQRLWRQESEN